MFSAGDFFSIYESPFADLFHDTEFVWDGLARVKSFISERLIPNVAGIRKGNAVIPETTILHRGRVYTAGFNFDLSGKKPLVFIEGELLKGASIIYEGAILMSDDIYIGEGVIIEPAALIKGPAMVMNDTEVRHGAYIRGDVLVGPDSVVGHTTEIKSSVMLGGSKAGHFAYIGDSILGKVNLGAGTKLANLKMIDSTISIKYEGQVYETGLRKFGAVLGDGVETGCNSVTTPGTLLGRNVFLYPNGTARGYYPPDRIIKVKQGQDQVGLDRNGK